MTSEGAIESNAGADSVVYLDGGFVAGADARVSVFDHGFAFGDGIFETIRVDGGVPRFLGRHVARLAGSLDELAIVHPPELARLEELIAQGLVEFGQRDASIKLIVTRGRGELSPESCGPPNFVMILRPLRTASERRYRSGVSAITLWAEQPGGRPGQSHKSLSYLRSVLARQEIEAAGAFEGFFTDAAGGLLEGSVSNVFAVAGGRLITAPVGLCLPGVVRAATLEAASARSIPVDQRPIDRDAVAMASEMFLTNALVGVMPIRSIDGADLPSVPGQVTAALSEAVAEAATAVG